MSSGPRRRPRHWHGVNDGIPFPSSATRVLVDWECPPIGGAAQDGAYTRRPRDLAFPGSLRTRRQDMAYWPKTLRGNVLTVLLIVVGLPLLVFLAISLSGPLVWAGLALGALTWVAGYFWRRKIEKARERAWVGAFSFREEVVRMH